MEGYPSNAYTCDVCSVEIAPSRDIRINCLECQNYDTCWNCHITGRASGVHQTWHHQQTIPPDPSLPPITAYRPPNPTVSYTSPPDPYWGYMITQQKGASELFSRLANALYTYIDFAFEPRQTSWLEPEKCSVVLDLLGYTPEENAFRSFDLESQHNRKGVTWSDEEVTFVYRQYGWDHTLASRASLQPVGVQQRDGNFIQPVSQGMPLLSRKGFVAMMLGDALRDPDDFCARLNRLLASIPLLVDPATEQYFARRDVPRSSWPAVADPEALWKVETVQQARIRRAEEQAAAERAVFVPNTSYLQDTSRYGVFDGRPPGPDSYWYYQQQFS